MMKHFIQAILCTSFALALADLSALKVAERNKVLKRPTQSDMINNYYSGPNCKKINQQLLQIRREIKGLKTNKTDCSGENELSLEVRQQLTDVKQEIKALKENLIGGQDGNWLIPGLKQQVAGIKKEIRELRENLTGGPNGNGLLSEVKQQLFELKEEIRALRRNQTKGEGGKASTTSRPFTPAPTPTSSSASTMSRAAPTPTPTSSPVFLKNCAEVYKAGNNISGVYKIDPDGLGTFDVFCDQKTAGGGWVVFQKRRNARVDFYRGWDDYKRGFGNLNDNFWLGLDKIHRLTTSGSNKLRVDLEDVPGNTAFAEYSSFAVMSEKAKYQLSLGSYSGTAGDSLGYHRGQAFTTRDRHNDKNGENCALRFKGAWWYNRCYYSNLNGLYLHGKIDDRGMSWYKWKNAHYSVKRSEMKIRPKDF